MSQTCSTRSSAFIFLLVYLIYEASLMPIGRKFSTSLSEGKKNYSLNKIHYVCYLVFHYLLARGQPKMFIFCTKIVSCLYAVFLNIRGLSMLLRFLLNISVCSFLLLMNLIV